MADIGAELSPSDYAALRRAYEALEHPSFAARVSGVLGTPIEKGLKLLPRSWHDTLQGAAEAAIRQALAVAIESLGKEPPGGAHDGLHRGLAMAAGAAGGFFGYPALLIELPITTTIMMRSIADVAHSHGEDLESLETQMACVEVFAAGGRSHGDDNAEIGYYEVRATLALHFTPIVATQGVRARDLPTVINLIRAVAGRFGIVVTDKAAAQLIPVAGAAAGALVNAAFMQHFQEVARGHFTIRSLERRYGAETVEAAYRAIAAAAAADAAHPTGRIDQVRERRAVSSRPRRARRPRNQPLRASAVGG